MKKLIARSKSGILKSTLRIGGLCSLAFMIEACYGTPQADFEHVPARDLDVSGKVSGSNGQPEAGVKVTLNTGSREYYSITGSDGTYYFDDVEPDAPVLVLSASASGGRSSASEIPAPLRSTPGERIEKDIRLND